MNHAGDARRLGAVDPSLAVIAAGVSAAVHVGKLPPALPALQQALGLTLVQSGFLLSVMQLAGMVLGLAIGLAAERVGLRRMMLAGTVCGIVGSLVGAQAQHAAVLLATRAVEGLGFLLIAMPGPSLLRRHVAPQRLAARLGVWGAYMPIGTGVALLLGPSWVAQWGWPSWWWASAVVSALAAALLLAAVPPDAPHASPSPAGGAAGAAGPVGARREPPATAASPARALSILLRAPGPWLIAIAFAVYSAQWLSVIGFLPTIYAQAGIAPATAGLATAIVAASNMVGNIASGRLLHRGAAPARLLRAGFGTMAAGALIAFAPLGLGPLLPFAAVVLFSAVGGLVPGTLFSLALRLTPPGAPVSSTVGWMQQWSSAGQFFGPPLVALAATASGSWQYSGWVTAAFAAAGWLVAGRVGTLLGRRAAQATGS